MNLNICGTKNHDDFLIIFSITCLFGSYQANFKTNQISLMPGFNHPNYDYIYACYKDSCY